MLAPLRDRNPRQCHANESRDWRVYEALAQVLIRKARRLYREDSNGLDIDEMVYADACIYDWPVPVDVSVGSFSQTKAAIKLHTQIDLTGSIPVFIKISDGSVHDVHVMDQMILEAGSIYVFNRGYLDFSRLFRIESANAFFVIRAKRNIRFSRCRSRSVDKSCGLRCDQTIRLSTYKGKRDYPGKLRRIRLFDTETRKRLVFLTNHFDLLAQVILMTSAKISYTKFRTLPKHVKNFIYLMIFFISSGEHSWFDPTLA